MKGETKIIKILGVESSCDDTCIAIVNSNKQILSNIVISQHQEHQVFHGIVPEIAARLHLNNLEKALSHVLNESNMRLSDIDGIAATIGPGLIGGLIVGSMFSQSIASVLKKSFFPINHLEGHLLTIRLTDNTQYPYLVLLISGGHCQFVAVLSLGKYKILGQTLDDSIGESFDKVAKMLNLSFPGGREIEKMAKFGNPFRFTLPEPMVTRSGCDMSFSGLKTAVRILISKLSVINRQDISDIAASFQYVIGKILTAKMTNSFKIYEALVKNHSLNYKTIVLAGGVASNEYLRLILKDRAITMGYTFLVPPKILCTDNAAMIAYAGLERFQNNIHYSFNVYPRARWSLENL